MMCCLPGPLFCRADFCEDVVYVTFDYGKGLKSSDGGPLRTFEVAETDGRLLSRSCRNNKRSDKSI